MYLAVLGQYSAMYVCSIILLLASCFFVAIEQVNGVMLMCKLVDMINRCNVTWNVSV